MIVGIDLGTTFSAIASVNASGVPVLLPDRHYAAMFHTPSVVCIDRRGRLAGEMVETLLEDDPALNVCRFAKAEIGTSRTVYTDEDGYGYPAHAVSACVLAKLKRDAEARTGEEITRAVISVPAHFNETQRRATVDAGRLAGLPVAGVVEEPVAAATFSALTKAKDDRTLFIFDLGGGTLDATVLQSTPEGLYVLATEGSENLGGRNFDEVIMDIVRGQYREQHRTDPGNDREIQQRLRRLSTELKLELSAPGGAIATRPLVLAGRPLRVTVNRNQFDLAAAPWLEGCQEVCERALVAARITWQQVDDLILTGGSSQLPCVERILRQLSGLAPERITRSHPRAAVVYGVALLAEQLYGDKPTQAPPLLQSVSTNELGLRVFDTQRNESTFQSMIGKNEPLPVRAGKQFYVDTRKSDSVTLEVLQRKDSFLPVETLGEHIFSGLPRGHAGRPLEVVLGYGRDGRVTVSAVDVDSGLSVEGEVRDEYESNLLDLRHRLERLPLLG